MPRAATQTYDEILNVAASVFDRLGFHAATMEDVARAAGLTKGGLYYYLSGKEETLLAIHERYLTAGLEEIRRIAGDSTTSSLDRLRRVIVELAAQQDRFRSELRLTLMELNALGSDNRSRVNEKRDAFEGVVGDLLEEGMADGHLRRGDRRLMTKFVFGSLNWMGVWYRPDGGYPADEIGVYFADLILGGLQV